MKVRSLAIYSLMIDFSLKRSWATAPLFYWAPSPPGMEAREYQHAAVEYALSRKHCLIGDAPGLGKTVEGILVSNATEAKRTLVVCPASLRLNWEREIWRWSTIPNVRTYPTLASRDGISNQAHYQIISYDLLRNESIMKAVLSMRWDHLILDEAHYLKDPKGNKRVRVICAPDGLPSVVGRITMLSGTILPNQPIECYNAVRLLDWDAIDRMSVDAFRNHYYSEGGGFVTGPYTAWDEKRQEKVHKHGVHWSNSVRNVPTNLEELRERLRTRVMIRRLKEHVLKELPPRLWHLFPLPLNKAIKEALDHPGWREAERMYQLDPDAFDAGVPIDGEISTARRLLGEAKAPVVAEYIDELFNEGITKLVVGAWHHTVLAYLTERLAKHGVVYMDGGTSPKKKQLAVDRFQKEDGIGIILGQMLPLGEGWPLTAAQDVVLVEPFWSPGKNDQLLDRPHRIGQQGDAVIGHVPVVPDSMDERILSRAIEKDIAINRALDGM